MDKSEVKKIVYRCIFMFLFFFFSTALLIWAEDRWQEARSQVINERILSVFVDCGASMPEMFPRTLEIFIEGPEPRETIRYYNFPNPPKCGQL